MMTVWEMDQISQELNPEQGPGISETTYPALPLHICIQMPSILWKTMQFQRNGKPCLLGAITEWGKC